MLYGLFINRADAGLEDELDVITNGHKAAGKLAAAIYSTQPPLWHWNVKSVQRSLMMKAL